jgi:hypothetical protein
MPLSAARAAAPSFAAAALDSSAALAWSVSASLSKSGPIEKSLMWVLVASMRVPRSANAAKSASL